ncbi:hypothetical protein nbrc107696_30430 [Gordonia spumicola]|uniref:DUF4192 domain-containing protein n=1 Tax=Gordonia spumicola TaxID=589161 RepID=A0A7I9VB55_9ACTN|nr:DUF4192 domain-containing protein [Gordonia spumicola]GEE02597.1 hypothetical protein nbrc107696_30430 [Gordonia spumicola]
MKITITSRIEGSRTVADPDPLLAAIPAVLGFVPERSIILMCFDARSHVTATMRHDLMWTRADRPPAELKKLFGRLGGLGTSYGATHVVAVAVDDRYRPDDAAFDHLFRDLNRGLRPAGGLTAGFAVSDMSVGAVWRTVWRSSSPFAMFPIALARSGVLSDPHCSPVALEKAVEHGRGILRRRDEMRELLAPAAHCDGADECVPVVPDAAHGAPSKDDPARLAAVYEAVLARTRGERTLSCATVNALADALTSVHVRDALLGLCLTVHREAAEELWLDLTRRLTGTARAAAATLLGYLHYMEGSGAMASVAFEAAHVADESYGLANLLDTALLNGMRPRDLDGLAELSFDLARRLGVTIPPATYSAAG